MFFKNKNIKATFFTIDFLIFTLKFDALFRFYFEKILQVIRLELPIYQEIFYFEKYIKKKDGNELKQFFQNKNLRMSFYVI